MYQQVIAQLYLYRIYSIFLKKVYDNYHTVARINIRRYQTSFHFHSDNGYYILVKYKIIKVPERLLDLELPYTPLPPPRGILQGYIFLRAYTKCYKMSHVSTLEVGAFRIFGVKREEIMQKSLKIGNNF